MYIFVTECQSKLSFFFGITVNWIRRMYGFHQNSSAIVFGHDKRCKNWVLKEISGSVIKTSNCFVWFYYQ